MTTPAWGNRAVQMVLEGRSIQQVCNELGTEWRETWNHVKNAKGTEGVTWRSAKQLSTIRLRQMAKERNPVVREQLRAEIYEYVEYIYTRAKRMRSKVDRARRTLNE